MNERIYRRNVIEAVMEWIFQHDPALVHIIKATNLTSSATLLSESKFNRWIGKFETQGLGLRFKHVCAIATAFASEIPNRYRQDTSVILALVPISLLYYFLSYTTGIHVVRRPEHKVV